MYHIVYKTTNSINNKFYIGVHSTLNPDDSYLGSGYLIKKAIKKHGRNNFVKEIICMGFSKEDAFFLERLILREQRIKNKKLLYNLAEGGEGHRGTNKKSKTVLLFDNNFKLIQSFTSQTEAARFIQVDPSTVKLACYYASVNKSSRIKKYYCCFEGDAPVMKNTTYLSVRNKNIMPGLNRGKKRPKHGLKIKELNLKRPAAMKQYKFIHNTGLVFIGTRTQLRDLYPEHKLRSCDLCTLCKGRVKTHRGWTVDMNN